MNLEVLIGAQAIGIGALCVSQGCMWWRTRRLEKQAAIDTARHFKALDDGAIARDKAIDDANEQFAEGLTEIVTIVRDAVSALPKRRNTRKPKTLEAKASPVPPGFVDSSPPEWVPSGDPVGPVTS
jgi:hypothetical protein